jgi:glycosyltransferase involved in cell wall biosynthesis
MKISVVIPVYNEEGSVKPLHRRVTKELKRITSSYEIIFVDDGSTDRTLKRMRKLAEDDDRITIITFYRNFGKANALNAGFRHARGDIVFTMDGDLQDDPSEFRNFIDKMDKGYDLVTGWKFHRKDPLGKRIPSKFFNYLIKKMTGVNVHDSNCGFKAYRKEVLEQIDVYGEFHRYLPIIANWRGFRVGEIKVKHHKRTHGRSKYGLERLFKGLMDLMTISFLTKYGRSPLYFFGSLSAFLFIISLIATAWAVVDAVMGITGVEWAFGLGSIMFLLTSILIFSFGMISEMLLQTVGHANMTKNHYRILKGK